MSLNNSSKKQIKVTQYTTSQLVHQEKEFKKLNRLNKKKLFKMFKKKNKVSQNLKPHKHCNNNNHPKHSHNKVFNWEPNKANKFIVDLSLILTIMDKTTYMEDNGDTATILMVLILDTQQSEAH